MSDNKIQKLIEKYNKKASKWGYESLSYDPASKKLTGRFSPKVDPESNAFKNLKGLYRDGYLQGSFEDIEKLVSNQ